ncbi:hypothetical protein, partial [Enterococcus faecalis]|uniref:hypothetical protein n=1 Tax=Enterococcus faecalis TaxID=1351 RepID=UPI00403F43D9
IEGGVTPAGPDKIAFAHVLRGVAALAVAASHFLSVFWMRPEAVGALLDVPSLEPVPLSFAVWLNGLQGYGPGGFGVALFFLISGF